MKEQILELFKYIDFGPQNGDWSSTLVAIIFGGIAFFGWIYKSVVEIKEARETRLTEERQNFMEYRERFDSLWIELTKKCRAHIYKDYSNKKELLDVLKNNEDIEYVKTITFQTISLLSDIYFVYDSKKMKDFWTPWEATMEHVFSKKIFKTAFLKHRKNFTYNNEFIKYVEKIINKSNSIDKEKNVKIGIQVSKENLC